MEQQKLRVVVVDDEKRATDNLCMLLQKLDNLSIEGIYNDPAKARADLPVLLPDLIFLDIEMPKISGLDLLKDLYDGNFRSAVIFITAYDHYAIEAIRYAAFDYLLKPVDEEELRAAVNRYIKKVQPVIEHQQMFRLLEKLSEDTRIKITTAGGFSLVHPNDIIYIEADWNYSDIYMSGGQKEMVTTNIGTLHDSLPRDQFFRISRSLIINTRYISRVSRKKRSVTLSKDGNEYSFQVPLLNIRRLEGFLDK